ncbi:MAG: hypothetical protein C5B44_00880 [Acidobacteria bacterium]|nr:MAG: hypothetical protein C5B44_00880 [Acidobacteriota bacterium]
MAETVPLLPTYSTGILPTSRRLNKSLYRDDEVVGDFLKVLKWCLIPILCFTAVWLIEIYVLQKPSRFVPNPAEFTSRVFGFSHHLVGLTFLLTSKKMRKLEGWAWFVGLLAVSAMIAIFFYKFGGRLNPVMVILYFLFFMVHGYRDMVFFYKPVTEDATLERTRSRILALMQVCLLIFLMNVLVPAYFFYRSLKPRSYSPELKAQIDALLPYLEGVLTLSWLLLPICLLGIWRLLRQFPEGGRGFWKDNKPVLLVLLYTSLIILASPLLGAWIFNLLILSHFVGWYFFASRRLAGLPRQSAREDGLWRWFRGSVTGFQRLHLGTAAIILVLIFINYVFLSGTGIINTLFSANAFYYWTVIHVTISFAPRS